MGDYPPQYYSPRARKYYRKRPSVAGGGGGGGASIGGWAEVGRTTLGSSSDTITVSGLADKRYYMILSSEIKSGTNSTPSIRFNNDSGSNYARRYHVLGGEYTNTSVDNIGMNISSSSGHQFQVGYWANYASNEKLGIIHAVSQQTAGAGNAPDKNKIAPKWANTSNAINRVDVINADSGTGDFGTGSEVVVLGWDPADTHTNNFWEELYSGTATSGQILDTGNFSAKKYLWIQAIVKGTGNSTSFMRFNSDSGSNYSTRYSIDGASDGTYTSLTSGFEWITSSTPNPAFFNMFIINNASNEKLAIHHCVHNFTSGSSNVPSRFETVQKWANTSNQITSIQLDRGSTGAHTNTIMKVWGAD